MRPTSTFFIAFFGAALFLSGCSLAGTSDSSNKQEAGEGTPQACGNGICDSIEEAQGLCSVDCGGSETTGQRSSSSGEGWDEITVEEVESSYVVADGNTSGFFTSGQDADLVLSAVGFNETGGSLLFNHQTGIATDGTRFVLADRNNNRVLIWNQLPTGNEEPDLVLGQSNFDTNAPGDGLDELNWPTAVATDGARLAVADTYNDRILVWSSWPTENGEAADFAIQGSDIRWPWGVWTNGEKLVISSTGTGKLLIWDKFPTTNSSADIQLSSDDIGTPRNIMSDGRSLAVGDHNAFSTKHGTFFWSEFPTQDNQPYDFFMGDPKSIGRESVMGAELFGGTSTRDGKFMAIANSGLFLWNSFPQDGDDAPDIIFDSFGYDGGDASGVAITKDKVYVSLSNGNRVVGFDGIPDEDQEPNFVIGAPDIYTNTYASNYFITNPVPASDGEHLFVSSDFDRTLSVWKQLPDESNAHPDVVYHNIGGWDNALYDGTFVIVGGNRKDTVTIWNDLPFGQDPDAVYQGGIGSVTFKELMGVALDGKYLYIADKQADKIYVWEGIPSEDDEPVYTLQSDEPLRLSSDGTTLAVTRTFAHSIDLYEVDNLEADPVSVGGQGVFNLPQGAEVADGHLFIGDTNFSYVHVWEDIADALAGKPAEIKLGQGGDPMIGIDTLFWPAVPAFDGSYLWVGEFKFSGRLLRFSPSD